jgi:hypothetical protein
MAQLLIDFDELEEGLPAVCMRCGRPATVFKEKRFTWFPQWIGLTLGVPPLFLLLLLLLRQRLTVTVPFCERHQNHWRSRARFALGGAAVLAGTAAAGAALLLALDHYGQADDLVGPFVLVLLVLIAAWLIPVAVLYSNVIRPVDMTDRSVSFAGVSRGFVDAMYDAREEDDEDEDDEDDWEDGKYSPRYRPRPGPRAAPRDEEAARGRRPPRDAFRKKNGGS